MAGFTREDLAAYKNRPVDDLIGDGARLMVVGINPGLWTAATNTHFCHPTNRFYPALRLAGMIEWDLDPTSGLTIQQRASLIDKGIAITNLVNRATARADELDADELKTGATRLTLLASEVRPKVVAVAGVTAYRTAFGRPKAALGPQTEGIGASELWVIPNPSGLNTHVSAADMAAWLRQVGSVAGLT